MNILARLKIGQRLGVGFATVLALAIVVGVLSVNRLASVNDNTRELATNWLVAMRELGEFTMEGATVRRAEAMYVMSDSPEVQDTQVKRAQVSKLTADAAWSRYLKTVDTDEERKLAADIQAAKDRFYADDSRLLAINHSDSGARDKLMALYTGDSRADFEAMNTAIKRDMAFQTKGGDGAYKDSQDTYAQARMAIIGLLAAAVTLGAVLAWVISRSITRPIAAALGVAETVAAGNLTSTVESTSSDEAGQLLRALKRMNESLVGIVSEVRNTSDSIATGSSQIAVGNADLSQRTEEQASNLQQTAASMEQLTATVKQNADTARAATQIASSASAAAAEGGRVVGQVVSTMEAITQSSRKIVDIIGVIDGIAFQTNILALNAAVEAARAGEQGRGFAVVASEVRSLAQRSAEAAKEIKSLIGASVDKVESGSRLVDEAGQSMSNIVTQVTRVNDLIGEISSASMEQSTGIGQIGDAVSQLDQVTQQNAALVEESAAAAESLKVQAAQLAQLVSAFKLSEERAVAKDRKAPAAPAAVARAAIPAARPPAARRPANVASAPAPTAASTQAAAKREEPVLAGADWESF